MEGKHTTEGRRKHGTGTHTKNITGKQQQQTITTSNTQQITLGHNHEIASDPELGNFAIDIPEAHSEHAGDVATAPLAANRFEDLRLFCAQGQNASGSAHAR